MGTTWAKRASLLGAAAIVFGVTILIGLKLLPGEHTDTDYLVVGSVATFLSLGVLAAVLVGTWMRVPKGAGKKVPPPPAES